MKFIIGTASSNMEFEEDLRLIKSSLLYADEIELIGMAEYAIFNYLPKCLTSANDFEVIINNLISLLKSFETDKTIKLVTQLEYVQEKIRPLLPSLKKKKFRTKNEIIAQQKFRTFENDFMGQLNEIYQQLTSNPGIKTIQSLVDNGIINIYDYSYNGFSIEELTGGYFANLLETIKHRKAYPLFDNVSANVISNVTDAKILDFSKMDKEMIRHAGVAHNILSTLPTLESASVDEILDFKRSMRVPLDNFRIAIYKFTEKINSMPWDDDFCYECIKLYDTEVIPRINELNELSSETSVLKNFGKRVLHDEEERKKLAFFGTGLVATITTSSNIFDVFSALEIFLMAGVKVGLTTTGIKAFLKTIDVLRQSIEEVQKEKKEIKGNTMYYYYKAKQKFC